MRMYLRFAENKGWKTEVLNVSEGELGGISEAVISIKGENVYSQLKYESGVHRVQRVPVTESQGRIHTSTATVAVMPEVGDVEVNIDPYAPILNKVGPSSSVTPPRIIPTS